MATAAAAVKEKDLPGEAEEGAEAAEPARKRWSGKRLVLFIALPIFLLICGVAGTMFSGILDPLLGIEKSEPVVEKKGEKKVAVFHDLPELLVNLNTTDRKSVV